MVFKEPQTRSEAISRAQQRDALIAAARVLDHCKIEPDTSGKLKRLAEQMDDAIQAGAKLTYSGTIGRKKNRPGSFTALLGRFQPTNR